MVHATLTSSMSIECSVSSGARGLQAVLEVLGEPLEAEVKTLDRALLDVEDVVHRHPIRPGLQAAPEVELRQPRDDADEDLLRRVLGVLAVPQHPEREAVDVGLKGSHQAVERLAVAVDGLPGDLLEPIGFVIR